MTTAIYSSISQVFACRWCQGDVALTTEPGGDLVYTCVNPTCGHSCMVDVVEGLALKDDADLLKATSEPAPLSVRIAAARAVYLAPQDAADRKALYYRSQGVAPVAQAGGWLVPSGSRASVVHFISAEGVCSCEASKRCWHQALVELVSAAPVAA
jgi:hypothetical protein